jgi:demethylmenaquinone methyltransferase/2-methoxy-6-polyprenyl-1,4-benzoquinol methylase
MNAVSERMEVKPYQEETGKKEQIEKMFDSISGRYDFLNRFLSLGTDIYWRKLMVNRLRKKQPKNILDIATGTADVAIAMRKISPEQIIGLDLSEGMLEIGREKVKKKGLGNLIQLVKGDSENLPYQENTFEAVTVAFGVRNFENLLKGLSEMNRVMKPGGKVVILEFSRPTIFPVKQLYDFYFRYFCPWWGKLISKDDSAYRYLYESVNAFPEGDSFLEVAKKAGFKELKAERVTFGIVSLYTGVK